MKFTRKGSGDVAPRIVRHLQSVRYERFTRMVQVSSASPPSLQHPFVCRETNRNHQINTKSQAKTKELTSLGNRKYEVTTNRNMREADYDKAFGDLEAKKDFDKKKEASLSDALAR